MAVLGILKVLYTFDVQSLYIFLKLFDSKVQPVLLHASEVWGLDGHRNQIVKTQMFAFKIAIGVGQRTPNTIIYGDTGRYPL